jgi:hypothetical protein
MAVVNGSSNRYAHERVAQFIGMFCLCLATRIFEAQLSYVIGGNSVDKAPAGKVLDWVKSQNGHTVITKVCNPIQNLLKT